MYQCVYLPCHWCWTVSVIQPATPSADDTIERLKQTEERIYSPLRLVTPAVTSASLTDIDHWPGHWAPLLRADGAHAHKQTHIQFRVIARDLCCLFSWEKLAIFLSHSQIYRDLAISVYYSCLSASPNCMLRAFACPMRGNSTGVHFCGGWKCRGRPERRSGSEHSRVSFFVHGAQPAWHFFFVLTVGDKTKENLISS